MSKAMLVIRFQEKCGECDLPCHCIHKHLVTIMEFSCGGMVVAAGGEHRDKQNIGRAVSADVT